MKGNIEDLIYDLYNYKTFAFLRRCESFKYKKQQLSSFRNELIEKYSLNKGEFTKYYALSRDRVQQPKLNTQFCFDYWR